MISQITDLLLLAGIIVCIISQIKTRKKIALLKVNLENFSHAILDFNSAIETGEKTVNNLKNLSHAVHKNNSEIGNPVPEKAKNKKEKMISDFFSLSRSDK